MSTINDFFENLLITLDPKHKKINSETEDIEKNNQYINSMVTSELSYQDKTNIIKENQQQVVESTSKFNKIKDKELDKEVFYDEKFLNDSLEGLDKFDYIFILSLVGIYITVNKVANKYNLEGKNTHEKHSKKVTIKDMEENLKINRVHSGMPNDKIPEGFLGITNPNGGRPGGSAKINGVSLNHRYIYGHDIFKPFELFRDLDKIEGVKPFCGSKTLGAISKQFYHLFFDTFSKTGIPAPGSTYFLDFLTKEFNILGCENKFRIIENQTDFLEYFSIHIEDIIVSDGMEAALYVYFRFRQIINSINSKEKISLKDIFKKIVTIDFKAKKSLWMANRTFKEYQIGIITHSLIIWFQLNSTDVYRGKLNYISIRSLTQDIIQYARLTKKWEENNRNFIINELQQLINLKIPDEKQEQYKELCMKNGIAYSEDRLQLMFNCKQENKIIYLDEVREECDNDNEC